MSWQRSQNASIDGLRFGVSVAQATMILLFSIIMNGCSKPQTLPQPVPIKLGPLAAPVDQLSCTLISWSTRHELTGDDLTQARAALKAILDDPKLLAYHSEAPAVEFYSIEYRDEQSKKLITTLRFHSALTVRDTGRYFLELSHVGGLLVSRSVVDELVALGDRLNIGYVVEKKPADTVTPSSARD